MTIFRKTKTRISCLYFVLLFLIFFWLVTETVSTIKFFTSTTQSANNTYSENIGTFTMKSSDSDYDLPIQEAPAGVVIKAKIQSFSANASYAPGASIREARYHKLRDIFQIVSLVLLFSLLVTNMRIIYLFIKGIKSENYFPSQNIILTKIIGALILLYALADSCTDVFNTLSLKDLLTNAGYNIDSYISFNYETLVVVLILFILSEVFSIGSTLSNDNKMTI